MKAYIGTKIIMAEPQEQNGRAGYRVIYPDGYASWSPKDTFEQAYREISRHERTLLEQTDAEHQVSAISDGNSDPFEHAPDCTWQKTSPDDCAYRMTHAYCPHPEHACNCK